MSNKLDPKRMDWLSSLSALRMLLHNSSCRNVEQFRQIEYRQTWYYYNTRTDNIMATLAVRGDGVRFLRYRPASWYAHVFVGFAELMRSQGREVICLPSTNVGRRQRRVRRDVNREGYNRHSVMARLFYDGGRKALRDGITGRTWAIESATRSSTPSVEFSYIPGNILVNNYNPSEVTWSQTSGTSVYDPSIYDQNAVYNAPMPATYPVVDPTVNVVTLSNGSSFSAWELPAILVDFRHEQEHAAGQGNPNGHRRYTQLVSEIERVMDSDWYHDQERAPRPSTSRTASVSTSTSSSSTTTTSSSTTALDTRAIERLLEEGF